MLDKGGRKIENQRRAYTLYTHTHVYTHMHAQMRRSTSVYAGHVSKYTALTVPSQYSTKSVPVPQLGSLHVQVAEISQLFATLSPSCCKPSPPNSASHPAVATGCQPRPPPGAQSHRSGSPGLSFVGTKTHLPADTIECFLLMGQPSLETSGKTSVCHLPQKPIGESAVRAPILRGPGILVSKTERHLFLSLCLLSALHPTFQWFFPHFVKTIKGEEARAT